MGIICPIPIPNENSTWSDICTDAPFIKGWACWMAYVLLIHGFEAGVIDRYEAVKYKKYD